MSWVFLLEVDYNDLLCSEVCCALIALYSLDSLKALDVSADLLKQPLLFIRLLLEILALEVYRLKLLLLLQADLINELLLSVKPHVESVLLV